MNKILDEYRKEIDTIDDEIMRAVSKRIAIVHKIGKLKKENGVKPLDENRWQQVLQDKLTKAKDLNLSDDLVRKLYNLIHEHSLTLQKEEK
jgi:chorismate mutase